MQDVKICPQCRAEYQTRAQQCADCLVPLVWQSQQESLPDAQPLDQQLWLELKPGEFLGQMLVDSWKNAGLLQAVLAEKGVKSATEQVSRFKGPEGQGDGTWWDYHLHSHQADQLWQVPMNETLGYGPVGLFLRREDYKKAEEILSGIWQQIHPDFELVAPPDFVEDQCPACGHPLAQDDEECPDCGLMF